MAQVGRPDFRVRNISESDVYADAAEFVQRAGSVPGGAAPDFRYAVEIRNQEFLTPEYFACLRTHGVAHVFNAWTRMPPIARADADCRKFSRRISR